MHLSLHSLTHQISPGDHSQDLVVLVNHAQVSQPEGAEHAVRTLYGKSDAEKEVERKVRAVSAREDRWAAQGTAKTHDRGMKASHMTKKK